MDPLDYSRIQQLLNPLESKPRDHRVLGEGGQRWRGFASVLVPLVEIDSVIHVLLTLRSSQLRHHAGEVAFPGGMWEEGDHFPVDTALRESEEEIALPRSKVQILGGLEEMDTRRFTRVYPIVGVIPDDIILIPNEGEIASIFTVPLGLFIQDERMRTDIFKRDIEDNEHYFWVPAYQYQEYEIWGFTASVIVQLVNCCFGANIKRTHDAPEQIW